MATSQGKAIDKGHLLRDTDKLLAQTAQYQQRLAELRKRSESLVDLAAQQSIINTPTDYSHAEKEWLGGPNEPLAWWPYVPDKEEILREGFIQAYELALQDPKGVKPIETYWIPGWTAFAAVALAGPGVTYLLLLTPPPPPGRLVGTIDQEVFVVASEQTIGSILDGYANRADAERNVAKTSCPGVQVFRVKGA
jgi:hypothetical protein